MVARLCVECVEQEALPRLQKCAECRLRSKPVIVRAAAAQARRELVPEHLRRTRVRKEDWPPGRRFCPWCQSFVSLRDVRPDSSRCQTCNGIGAHASRIEKQFGLDPDSYAALLTKQSGRCAICENLPKKARLSVDHDHTCQQCGGKGCLRCIRGLLCSRCNDELLGASYHSAFVLRSAIEYLTAPPAQDDKWMSPSRRRGEPEPAPY